MLTCPSCTATLPERGFYCGTCAVQVRCKGCNEPLDRGACACVMCGLPVNGSKANTAAGTGHSSAINTFELEEDLNSRKIRVYLTDRAVENVGDGLASMLCDRFKGKIASAPRVIERVDSTAKSLASAGRWSDWPDESLGTPASPKPVETTLPIGSDRDRLRRIFEYDGDELRLEEDRLKADSGQAYARRLVYLFLYAHELEGRKPVPYADLKKILEAAKVWDNNTRHAIAHKLSVEVSDDSVRLKAHGRESAIEALDQILDPNYQDPGWTPEAKNRAVRQVGDTKGVGKPGRKRNVQGEEWAVEWEKHQDFVNGHYVVKDKPVHDKAMLALWAIHKVGGIAATSRQIQRFIKAAFSFQENDRGIDNALARKQGEDLVIRGDGGFKLTPTGTRHVESLLGES